MSEDLISSARPLLFCGMFVFRRRSLEVFRKVAATMAVGLLAGLGGCEDLTWEAQLSNKKDPKAVDVLLYPPPTSYVTLGPVSTPENSTDGWKNYRALQRQAARRGGDAVILTDGEVYAGDDFWTRPHEGVVISYTTSSLHEYASQQANY